MGRIAKIVAGIVVVVVGLGAAGVAILASMDFNEYRSLIAEQTRAATGRQLVIEGDLKLDISLNPALAVERVSFANAPWGSRPEMLKLQRLEAQVALLPLLGGDIQVKRIVLVGVDALIETDRQGRGNWEFAPSAAPARPSAPDKAGPTKLPVINEVRLDSVKVVYRDGKTGESTAASIDSLTVRADGVDSPIQIALGATLNGAKIAASGRLGAASALLEGGKPYPVNLEIKALEATAKIDGSVADARALRGLDLAVALQGAELATTLAAAKPLVPALKDVSVPPVGPYAISARLRGALDRLAVADLKAMIGKAELLRVTAAGAVADAIAAKGVDLAIAAEGREIADIIRLAQPFAPALKDLKPQPVGPLAFAAKIGGSLDRLAVSGIDLAAGSPDKAQLKLSGDIADALTAKGFDLGVGIEARSLVHLAAIGGIEIPSVPPLSLAAKLADRDGGYAVDGLKAKVGGSNIEGRIVLRLVGARPAVNAQLASQVLDLGELLPVEEKKAEARTPAAPVPTARPAADKRVFPADPLPLNALKAADARAVIKIARLVAPQGLALTDVDLDLSLDNGRLEVKPLDADVAKGKAAVRGVVDASRGAAAALDLNADAKGVDLGGLLRTMQVTNMLEGGAADARVALKGRGASIRELMAGLDGEVVLSLDKGRINNKALNLASGDLGMTAFNAINPLAKREDSTELRCGVVRFVVKDGMATADNGIAIETARMNVVGSGTVNLKNEAIDFAVKPEAREGLGLNLASVASLVRIKGTLGEPSVGMDPLGTARGAATIGAAIATGGLSLLTDGLIQRATTDDQPCRTALGLKPAPRETGRPASGGGQAPAASPAPGGQPSGPAGMMEGIGRSLQGIFGGQGR